MTASILPFVLPGSQPGAVPMADVGPFALCTEPGAFARMAMAWSRCPELWIDTETADWRTSRPRLSLLQVRTPEGALAIVDILAPGMAEVLATAFIPAVMANPDVRKWAHNASYERRFLGRERIQNLQCTLKLARSIPFHRLPVRRLTLAALAGQLLGADLDKSHQADDWGVRPLSPSQLAYAAGDPEWCHRVHQALEARVVTFDPAYEDPAEIRAQFLDVGARFRERWARREDIRAAVKDHLLAGSGDMYGGFRLHRRLMPAATIGELARVADDLDPGATLEFTTSVPKPLRDDLATRDFEALRAISNVKASRVFRGPRLPGGREEPIPYSIDGVDAAEVDRQYGEIDHTRRCLDSEREELKDRMKAWLERKGRDEFEGFKIGEPAERWSVDMRTLVERVPAAALREVQVPKAFMLAFGAGVVDRMATTSKESAFVMWRERLGTKLDPEASQSRDWQETGTEDNSS